MKGTTLKKCKALGLAALTTIGTLANAATSTAYAAPAGQADCETIQFEGSHASTDCQNNTNHDVIAEMWINCKPASPDRHTSATVSPGSTKRLVLDCPTPWDHAEGGAASVH